MPILFQGMKSGFFDRQIRGRRHCGLRQIRLPRLSALAILVSILGSTAPAKAEPGEKLPALEIFDAALAKFEADRVALHSWQYYQTLTTHQFDANGKIVAKG